MPPAQLVLHEDGDHSATALADSKGRVVGINTAVAGIGLGLAVPINATTERQRARFGQRTAMRVVEVVAGSPAASAGLVPGDLLIAFNGAPLGTPQSLQGKLFEDAIDTRTEITVLRNGALVDVIAFPDQ